MNKTIKIIVCINDIGEWTCRGGDNYTDKEAICFANEDVAERDGRNATIHFIEAVIPIPISQTIKGFKTNV